MKQCGNFKIVLTGGGTAGHVMPHLALLGEMKARSWEVSYIGTAAIEKELVTREGIPFYTIKAGKLRRYFSFQNLLDVFKCFFGFLGSLYYLFRLKPDLVFSKGGYVSVPVCLGAWILRIPIATHESDVTPGLANKIIMKMTKKVFYSFPQSKKYLPQHAEHVLLPVRRELFEGSKEKALSLCDFEEGDKRSVILVMGGSQGALTLNKALIQGAPELLEKYRVIHITGRGKKTSYENKGSYCQKEYAKEELKDFLALADLVVSRAGANSIFEFHALSKPMVLVPLAQNSRGDQIVNAKCFAEKNWAVLKDEKNLNPASLLSACDKAILNCFSEKESLEIKKNHQIKNQKFFLDKLCSYRSEK